MKKEINDLIEISHEYGSKIEYVIAGGGNTSYKNEDYIWIKASGTSLATIQEDGFVCLSRKKLEAIASKEYSADAQQREQEVKVDLNACIVSSNGLRPSVETSLHDIIDYPFVVHTHPTLVNGLLCSNNAEKVINELFSDDSLFIEYTDPGYILFKVILERLNEYKASHGKQPRIIFLENHGIFVAGDNIDEIRNIYDDVNTRILSRVKDPLPSSANDSEPLTKRTLNGNLNLVFKSRTNDLIHFYTQDQEHFNKVSIPFTPDNIVYCKSKYLFLDDVKEETLESILKNNIESFRAMHGYNPKIVTMKGIGLGALEESEKSADTALDVFEDMMKISFYAESFGGPQFMTPPQIEFIDNWEVENYRRSIAKKG